MPYTPLWQFIYVSLCDVYPSLKIHKPLFEVCTAPDLTYINLWQVIHLSYCAVCPSLKIRKPLFDIYTAPIWCNIYRIILAIVRRFFPKYLAVKPYSCYVQTLNIISSFFPEISVQKRNSYYPWAMGSHYNRYHMKPLSDELYTSPDVPYTHYPQSINLSMMIHVAFLMC